NLSHEGLKLVVTNGGTGRVIWVADKHQAGLIRNGRSETIHIEPLLRSKLHRHWSCADDLGENWISLEAAPWENHLIIGSGGGVDQLLAQRGGTSAHRGLFKIHA